MRHCPDNPLQESLMAFPARLDTPRAPLSAPSPVVVWTLARTPGLGRALGRPVKFCPELGVWLFTDSPVFLFPVRGPVVVRRVGEKN